MTNKKVIGGIVAALAIISMIAFIPMFMYGFTVNATEVNIGMSMGGTLTSSEISISSIEINQAPTFDPGTTGAEAKERVISAYEYLFSKIGGPAEVSEQVGSVGGNYVDIYIIFNLTTPSNKTLIYEFSPQDLNVEGLEVTLLLGPDELAEETGTFHLEITIRIVITIPTYELPVVDETLTPVNLDFTVPAA